MPIRLICIDIDGTLLDSRHRLPPENRAAIQQAAESGVVICLMTARSPAGTLPIRQELGVPGPTACFGGSFLEYQGQRLLDHRVPAKAAVALAETVMSRGLHLSVYRDNDWFIGGEDAWSRQETAITGIKPSCAGLRELLSSWGENGAHKLMMMGEPEELDRLLPGLEEQKLPLRLLHSKDTYLEALPREASKAKAMLALCERLGISAGEVMALGDQDQDVSMLQAAGFGVAMGNSSQAAWTAARYHTGTNDQAGVAAAIYKGLAGEL